MMKRRWSKPHEAEIFETFWQNLEPGTHLSHGQCPIDGTDLSMLLLPHCDPNRYMVVATCPHPDCQRVLMMSEDRDPRADELKDRPWTTTERAWMVRRVLNGYSLVKCPSDGTALRAGRYLDEDERIHVWIRCWRCGNEIEEAAPADHRPDPE